MDLSPTHDYITSWRGDLKNMCSLNYADLLKYWHIPYNIENSVFVNITADLIQKVFNNWEHQAHEGIYMFSKNMIFA